MKILFNISLLVAITIVIVNCDKGPKNYSPEQHAVISSAITWLNLIDKGEYGESWVSASNSFKENVTKRQWDIGLTYMRKSYGRALSRGVKSCILSEYDLDLGKNHKAIVQFQTSFENQETLSEFVTLQFTGGAWLVSSYYLDR